jgi:hypothetical protein
MPAQQQSSAYIIYVIIFSVISLHYFEKVFVCGFVVLLLFFVVVVVVAAAAFICMFYIFMTYFTSYCCQYKFIEVHGMYACMCLYMQSRVAAHQVAAPIWT